MYLAGRCRSSSRSSGQSAGSPVKHLFGNHEMRADVVAHHEAVAHWIFAWNGSHNASFEQPVKFGTKFIRYFTPGFSRYCDCPDEVANELRAKLYRLFEAGV